MIAILLASSLWMSANTAGERYAQDSFPTVMVPIERISDALATDLIFNGLGTSADLMSTDWGLQRGCREANPLGQRVEGRVALKVGGMVTRAVVSYWLRRSGHRVGANVWRYAGLAVDLGLTVNNVACGRRKQ